MIEQVLKRTFVLSVLKQVEAHLAAAAKPSARRRGPSEPIEGVGPEELSQALREVRGALSSEKRGSSGQIDFDLPRPTGRRRGARQAEAGIDEVSFFSRSAVVSNLQSAMDEYLQQRRPELLEAIGPGGARRRGRPAFVPAAEQRLRPRPSGRRLIGPFEPGDVGWVSAGVAKGLSWLRGRHSFPVRPGTDQPYLIGNRARVLLVADWATGIPRAVQVAQRMRDVLQEPGAREQHVIHLGDVYYSGWPGEYQKRFLAPWPVDTAKKDQIGSWILNGNHDMYSGGKGFWETALADPRFHRQQNYSYFCLENDHWKIFGLDTAYDDHALKDPQAAWVKAGMDAAPGKQILLFSHHQPFSAYEKGGPKLVKKLNAVLNTGRITAWFWGHEHRCVLYDGHQNVGFGRCIGHGGVPVYMNHSPGEQVPSPGNYEYRATMGSDGLFPWARFGFAILDFEDATIHVRYLDELGDPYHSETIPATAPPAGRRRAPRRR